MSLMPADGYDGKPIKIRFQLHRYNAAVWTSLNSVLLAAEPGVELDTGKFKMGDGVTPWNELPYYLNEDDVAVLVAQMIADADLGGGGGSGDVTTAQLQAHIEDEAPHPVYDDGTSFVLRYENAKV